VIYFGPIEGKPRDVKVAIPLDASVDEVANSRKGGAMHTVKMGIEVESKFGSTAFRAGQIRWFVGDQPAFPKDFQEHISLGHSRTAFRTGRQCITKWKARNFHEITALATQAGVIHQDV